MDFQQIIQKLENNFSHDDIGDWEGEEKPATRQLNWFTLMTPRPDYINYVTSNRQITDLAVGHTQLIRQLNSKLGQQFQSYAIS